MQETVSTDLDARNKTTRVFPSRDDLTNVLTREIRRAFDVCIITSDDSDLFAHPRFIQILITSKVLSFRTDKPVNLIRKVNLY